nr:MAG TPA: hypothetical protein [Caudoviricetes sp.]
MISFWRSTNGVKHSGDKDKGVKAPLLPREQRRNQKES